MAAEFLRLMPRYVAGVGCAAGAAVAMGRYFQVEVPWQGVAIVAAGMAISGAAVHAAAKRWTLRRAAERADTTLGLHDQIGNAIELAERGGGGFGELAIASGERVASTVDVSRTVNLRWWSKWWIGSVAAAGLAVAAWFYSPMPAAPPVVTAQDAKKALEDARKIAEAQPPQTADQPIEQPKPELQELAQIEKELAQGAMSPTDAATRAASVLERVADERAKSADAGKTEFDNARESLAQAAKPAVDKSPADSSALRKALQAGDLDAAAAEAQKLAENAESLTPDERSLLESDLRDLAQALDQQARESAAEAAKLQEEAREAQEISGEPSKPEAGADESAAQNDSNTPENPPEDPKKAISDAARQAAEELKKLSEKPDSKEKDPADSNPEKGDAESQPPKNGDAQQDESKPSEESPNESGKSGEPKQNDSAKGETKPGEKSGEKTGEKTSGKTGEKPDKPGEQSGEKANPPPDSGKASDKTQPGESKPGENKSGENKAPGQTEKPGDNAAPNQKDQTGTPTSDKNNSGQKQQQSPEGQKPDSANGEQKSTSEKGTEKGTESNSDKQPAGEKSGDGKPQAGAEENPQQSQPAPGGKQQGSKEGAKDGSGTGLQNLAKQLKDLQKKSKDAASNEKSSKEMREQARKILENMDPAQRKELQRQLAGAGKGEGEGNGPGDQPPMPKDPAAKSSEWSGASKIVDFRTKPGDAAAPGKERVISDWQKDMPDGQRDASAAGSAMEEDIRQAKESAERAIEQQSVPAQHRDLVRRVFEKFNQRVDTAKKSAPSANPATPAPDAKPAGGGGK